MARKRESQPATLGEVLPVVLRFLEPGDEQEFCDWLAEDRLVDFFLANDTNRAHLLVSFKSIKRTSPPVRRRRGHATNL